MKAEEGREMQGWMGGTGPYREGEAVEGAGSHYSVILLKMPLKDSPREARRKESEWNVTTEKCH